MNKRLNYLTMIFAMVLLISSCSHISPLTATSNPVGKKVGTSKATFIFGICFGGDYSVQTAAKNGGITKISTVDVRNYNALGVVVTRKVIVTGE